MGFQIVNGTIWKFFKWHGMFSFLFPLPQIITNLVAYNNTKLSPYSFVDQCQQTGLTGLKPSCQEGLQCFSEGSRGRFNSCMQPPFLDSRLFLPTSRLVTLHLSDLFFYFHISWGQTEMDDSFHGPWWLHCSQPNITGSFLHLRVLGIITAIKSLLLCTAIYLQVWGFKHVYFRGNYFDHHI